MCGSLAGEINETFAYTRVVSTDDRWYEGVGQAAYNSCAKYAAAVLGARDGQALLPGRLTIKEANGYSGEPTFDGIGIFHRAQVFTGPGTYAFPAGDNDNSLGVDFVVKSDDGNRASVNFGTRTYDDALHPAAAITINADASGSLEFTDLDYTGGTGEYSREIDRDLDGRDGIGLAGRIEWTCARK